MKTNNSSAPKGYKIAVQPYSPTKEYLSKDLLDNFVDTKFVCELSTTNPVLGKFLFQHKHSGYLASPHKHTYEKIEECYVWANIYKSEFDRGSWYGRVHSTREEADKGSASGRLACVKVKFEVGEGL